MVRAIIFTMRSICLILIRIYQLLISPFFGNCCRFYPTCSEYAKEAFATHALHKAFYLTARRILSCQPLHKGGIDLVPGKCE